MRKIVAVVACLGMCLVALIALPTANALPVCTLMVAAPAKVSIGSAYAQINYSSTTNCTSYVYADVGWRDVYGDSHYSVPGQRFSPAAPSVTYLYQAGNGNGMGAYHSVLESVNDPNESVALTTTFMTIKYSSLTYFTPVRRGAAVFVNILAKQYVPSAAGYGSSPNRLVYLQRFIGGGWQTMLGHITADDGSDTFGFIQSHPYVYRVVTVESSDAWGRTSGVAAK